MYALRHSFSTECAHAGVRREIREFWMGHISGIAFVYQHGDELHEEDFIQEYAKAKLLTLRERTDFEAYERALLEYLDLYIRNDFPAEARRVEAKLIRQGKIPPDSRAKREEAEKHLRRFEARDVETIERLIDYYRENPEKGRLKKPDGQAIQRVKRILDNKRLKELYDKVSTPPKSVLVLPLFGFGGYDEKLRELTAEGLKGEYLTEGENKDPWEAATPKSWRSLE